MVVWVRNPVDSMGHHTELVGMSHNCRKWNEIKKIILHKALYHRLPSWKNTQSTLDLRTKPPNDRDYTELHFFSMSDWTYFEAISELFFLMWFVFPAELSESQKSE